MPHLTSRRHSKFEPRPARKSTLPLHRTPAPRSPRPHAVVLLVDDDPAVLESLRRVFALEGLHVVTADGGERALELLDSLHPHLVITDLCMGEVSGWDLVFHHHLHQTGLPFFVISALSALEAGGVENLAAGFFQKPLNLEELLGAIHGHLAAQGAPPADEFLSSSLDPVPALRYE